MNNIEIAEQLYEQYLEISKLEGSEPSKKGWENYVELHLTKLKRYKEAKEKYDRKSHA